MWRKPLKKKRKEEREGTNTKQNRKRTGGEVIGQEQLGEERARDKIEIYIPENKINKIKNIFYQEETRKIERLIGGQVRLRKKEEEVGREGERYRGGYRIEIEIKERNKYSLTQIQSIIEKVMEGEGIDKAIQKTIVEEHSDGVGCVTDKLRVKMESGQAATGGQTK